MFLFWQKKPNKKKSMEKNWLKDAKSQYVCPQCNVPIDIVAINCGIFIHGFYKHNNQQINPHSSRSECEAMIKKSEIYGCGKCFGVKLNGLQEFELYGLEYES